MNTVLAIDPGPTRSAYVTIDAATCRPRRIACAITDNEDLRDKLRTGVIYGNPTAIEMVASYGMPVGAEVFETCVWIGRFYEHAWDIIRPRLVYRRDVKLHHCGSARANDANITQALVDRFAPGQPNKGKGTKANPGWFYGFSKDLWQAYALAVYVADGARPDDTDSEGGDDGQ